MFFRVQVFKGTGLSGSGSSVRIQVLEVVLHIYMEIALRHRCSPVNFLPNSQNLFVRTPLSACFCMLKLWFHCFCIASLILSIMYWSAEAATGRSSTKKLHLYSKVTWRSSSFSSVVVSKLTNLLNWTCPHVCFIS